MLEYSSRHLTLIVPLYMHTILTELSGFLQINICNEVCLCMCDQKFFFFPSTVWERREPDCVGPTLDWHLNTNKYHIVCAAKRLPLASPGECLLASKLHHCPREEKVSYQGENRRWENCSLWQQEEGSYAFLVSWGNVQWWIFSTKPGLPELVLTPPTCETFTWSDGRGFCNQLALAVRTRSPSLIGFKWSQGIRT